MSVCPQVELAQLKAAWPVGTFAKQGAKVGKTTRALDGDKRVKLEWADGSGTSGYIKVADLTRSTWGEWIDAERLAVSPQLRSIRRLRVLRCVWFLYFWCCLHAQSMQFFYLRSDTPEHAF